MTSIGIVDGTMGILSRKMAMPAQIPANPIHYKEVLNPKKIDPKKYFFLINSKYGRLQPKADLFAPVLGGKSYTGARNQ